MAKYKPLFFQELAEYPLYNPILISVDWNCLNYIRKYSGVCLLCNFLPSMYDLSFCFGREIWVLYSNPYDLDQALVLARSIQLAGAEKVDILLVTLRVVNHDNNKNTYPHRTAIN